MQSHENLTQALFRIANAVNTTENLNDLYKSIHQSLNHIIDATNFFIAIYDRPNDVISFPYYVDMADGTQTNITNASNSSALTSEVIQTGRPHFFKKADIIARAKQMKLNVSGTPSALWLGVPLKTKGDIIGAIVVQSYHDPNVYHQTDMDLLIAVSDQVALAIERKRAEDAEAKSKAINKVLFSISNAVNTTTNLLDLYESIHASVGKIIDLTNFIIGLYNKKDNTITFEYYVDQFDDLQGQSMTLAKGSVGRDVILSGNTVFLKEEELNTRFRKNQAVGTWSKAWIGVPLKVDDKVIGYMAAQSYDSPDAYSREDLEILNSVSDQVAIAIGRKRSHEELKHNEKLTNALLKISNAVNITENLNDLYQSIHKALEPVVDVTNFAIGLYDKSRDLITYPYYIDETGDVYNEIKDVSKSSIMAGEVIKQKEPIFITKDRVLSRAKSKGKELLGSVSEQWLGVPLRIKKEVIGVIVVQSYEDPERYQKKDADILLSISDQIAIAIDRKKAQENVVKSENFTRALFKISNAVNTTENLDELYYSIYNTLNQLKPLPNFIISMVHEEQKLVKFPLFIDEYDKAPVNNEIPYDKKGTSLTVEVINQRKPIFLNKKQLEEKHGNQKAVGSASFVWLGIPLIIREKVIGVMIIQHYTDEHYFVPEDMDLFVSVSDQVALAIDRKRSQNIILEHKENLEKTVENRTKELTSEIAERIQVEKRLKSAKVAAEVAAKSKSEFLTNMSHEIRTPINGIMGMAEIALGNKLDTELKTIISTIDSEANSLLDIVNQILDFSKIEAGKLTLESIPFDLRNTFEQACSSVAIGGKRKSVELISFLSPDIATQVMGDPGRLRQILVNLTSNAIKFTHEGEVYIKGEMVSETHTHLGLRFLVKDTGIGIAPDKKNKIFDSFIQADGSTTREYGGTGLGTTISKQLVELMGGHIGVESDEGKGSTFWFTIMFEKQKGVIKERHEPELGNKSDLKGLSVLIADQNKTNRYVFAQYLKSFGAIPIIADNNEDVLLTLETRLQTEKPIDALLINLRISDPDDLAFLKTLKENIRLSRIPIIILTSSGSLGDGHICKDLGVDAYLLKPVKKDELKIALNKVLGFDKTLEREEIELITRHTIAEEKNRNIRILLVEDYPTNQKVAMRHLTQAGYHVTVADNGKIAVDLFIKTHFDLILMDIQMPIMDGYEATRLIRDYEAKLMDVKLNDADKNVALENRIPIIALTAHALDGYRDECLKADMDDFCTKPIKKEPFLLMIENWVSKIKPPTDTAGTAHKLDMESESSFPHKPSSQAISSKENINEMTNPLDGPPMDYPKALKEFEDDEDFLAEVLEEFIENVEAQLIVMAQAIAARDSETLRKESHSIKGGSANLTAMTLSTIAHDLELIGKSGSLNGSTPVFEKLKIEFDRLKRVVFK